MKITRNQLLANDYDILFTHDPGTFIEAIIINLLWAKGNEVEAETIERQRYIFEHWIQLYSANLREDILQELGEDKTLVDRNYQNGYLAGQIHALSTLPMKKSVISTYVDLIAVSEKLRTLKAEVPKE